MKMIRNNFKKFFVLFFVAVIGLFIFNSVNVNAAESSYTLTKGGRIWYSSSGYIVKHYFGELPAYCMQWRLSTYNGSKYIPYSPSSMTERNKFIAGYAIKLIEEEYADNEDLKHLYATEAINCLFGLSGSVCYQKGKEYIEKATAYVDTHQKLCEGINTSGCLNNEGFKLSQSSSTLSQIGTSSNFISKKVTLSGLLKTYGGDEFGVTYKISVSSSAGNTVSICSKANGSGCSGSTVTLTDKEGDYSFYVKVNEATAGSTVKIKATASNSATYPYGIAYRYTSSYQALMIREDKTVSRGLSRTATLNIPDKTKYTITARKVDENGEDLTGANFEIYRISNSSDDETILKKNKNGEATLSYVEEEYANSDDWFNFTYCLRETSAPSGYVYNKTNEIENPLCLTVSKNSETFCYNEENEEVSDIEKCNSHTKKCSASQGEMIEGTNDCMASIEAVDNVVDAKASCPSGYEVDLEKQKCVVDEDGDSLFEETSGTSETSNTSAMLYSSEVVTSGTEEDSSELDLEYVCDSGTRVVDSETNKVTCVTKTCSEEGYTYDEDLKTCTKITEASLCHSDRSAYNGDENVDMSYCNDQTSYTFVTVSGGNIDFVKTNNRNSVTISKTDITGEEELPGARMKVCTTKPDANLDCEIAVVTRSGQCTESALAAGTCTNVDEDTMNVQAQWISDITSRTIRGLATGQTYYLVETVAPLGYEISQYTKFVISDDGTVMAGDSIVENGKILVKNDLNKFTVSKQDMTTSKELPGAEITICYAGKNEKDEYQMGVDEEGNCTVPTLLNGEDAKWISTDKPHVIEGLAAGAYYLVETITPDGYDTAEKILFIVNQDGSISNAKGELISDNKIVMYDKPIVSPPTGDIMIALVILLGIGGLGFGVYYYFKYYKKPNELKSS